MNTQIRVSSLLVACVFTLSACGVVKSARLESMNSEERYERLSKAENDQLCRALFNPILKEQTLQQIKEILRERGVEKCQSGKKVVRLMPETPRVERAPQMASWATAAEQEAIEEAVRRTLIDPTSPLFGQALIVDKEKGCLSVNAKNRFGGYTGNKWVLVIRSGQDGWLTLMDFSDELLCLGAMRRN